MPLIGLLGGTFNPIHLGHLRLAQELAIALNLSEVRFIPSAQPPHKSIPSVSAEHRAEMVKLAIADNPLFRFEPCELNRTGASYTIDTLIALRAEIGTDAALCLIMGSDAFVKIETWSRWQELLNYCHIVLVQRPNQQKLSDHLSDFLQAHYTEHPQDLAQNPAGYIHMQAITALDISSTAIRRLLNSQQSPRYLLPEPVLDYIEQQRLYAA